MTLKQFNEAVEEILQKDSPLNFVRGLSSRTNHIIVSFNVVETKQFWSRYPYINYKSLCHKSGSGFISKPRIRVCYNCVKEYVNAKKEEKQRDN